MNIEIKNRWTNSVIYSGDYQYLSLCIVDAIRKKINLRGANLRGANLRDADLRGANLCGADLCGANLCGADLCGANLCDAELRDAELCDANLRGANLCGANLRDADLCGANLCGADLCGANLCGANLRGANLCDAKDAKLAIAMTRILPAGAITGWKKARDFETGQAVIVELEIPKDARRSSAFGRKCRADRAVVISISQGTKAYSTYVSDFFYEVGKTVAPTEPFSEEWTQECAPGIHFFITREEAEAY